MSTLLLHHPLHRPNNWVVGMKLVLYNSQYNSSDNVPNTIPVVSIMCPVAVLVPSDTPGISLGSVNLMENVSLLSSMTLSCIIGIVIEVIWLPGSITPLIGVATKSSPAERKVDFSLVHNNKYTNLLLFDL